MDTPDVSQAAAAFAAVVGPQHVTTNQIELAAATDNTLGATNTILGIIYPASTKEVADVVSVANSHNAPLYPISKGKNVGYGEKQPPRSGQWIVDLGRMKQVRKYDEVQGHVIIEPGVDQGHLYQYLIDQAAPYWMDVTGAGLEASIVGNIAEGGFGHTPRGNRRQLVQNLEIVLGSGEIVTTEDFPGLGPDLSGLFVQSNFGIITAATVVLMPIPEHFESFVASFDDQKLDEFIDIIRHLRQHEVVSSAVHVANALRALMSSQELKPDTKLITNKDAARMLSSSFLKISDWAATGGLYGSRVEVEAKKQIIKRLVNPVGRIRFFSDRKLERLQRLVASPPVSWLPPIQSIRDSLEGYSHFHGLLRGIPSDEPMKHINWRVPDSHKLGAIWIGPTVDATAPDIRAMISTAQEVFDRYGHEMAITFTYVEPAQVVGIFNFTFNRDDSRETERTQQAYHDLVKAFMKRGIKQYRASTLSTPLISYQPGKAQTLANLKAALDPNNIIAPGRYGISAEPDKPS